MSGPPKRGSRGRYIGPWEWQNPEGYRWTERSEQPGPGQVDPGIVEVGNLWIGRVVTLDGDRTRPFGFRVMRHDIKADGSSTLVGDRMLRFAGEWPAHVTRRKVIQALKYLAEEEVWEMILDDSSGRM